MKDDPVALTELFAVLREMKANLHGIAAEGLPPLTQEHMTALSFRLFSVLHWLPVEALQPPRAAGGEEPQL